MEVCAMEYRRADGQCMHEAIRESSGGRVMVTGLLLIAILFFVAGGEVASSELERRKPVFVLNVAGRLEVHYFPVPGYGAILDEAAFLASDVVLNELDAHDYQTKELAEILEHYESEFERIKSDVARNRPQAVDRLLALRDRTRKRLSDVLLPHQLRRLSQIQLRCRLRRRGFCRELYVGELGSKLGVDFATKNRIDAKAHEVAVELSEKSLKRRKEIIDELVKVLSDEQLADFKREMGEFFYGSEGNIELLCHQLGYERKPERRQHDPYCGFRATPVFEIHVDGTLRPLPRPKRHRRKKLVEIVLPLLEHDVLKEALAIDDEQQQALDALLDYRKARLDELSEEVVRKVIGTTGEVIADRETQERLRQKLKREQETLWNVVDSKFREVLRPDQFVRLQACSRQLDVARNGIVAALVDGPMGEVLKITDDQKSALLKRARELRAKLVRETAQWQREAMDELLHELDEDRRRQLKELLGPPLSNAPGHITLMILDFQ